MSGSMRIAVAQQTSTPDTEANLRWMEAAIAEAAAGGARLIAFPENAPFMGPEADRLAAPEGVDGPSMGRIAAAARSQRIAVLVGSFAEKGPDAGRTYNTSLFFDDGGQLLATYRKIHLFDVTVSADTVYRESASVAAGEPVAVVVPFDGWKFGLSICYDLRFPELYRALSAAGAEVLFVPAAFTVRTGMAHWHLLLRARAVENLAYVVAPAQVGTHFGQRETYGHALVVAPWGEVVAEAEGGAGLIFAELKRERVAAVRAQIPALEHRRL
jgi:predicted amidohydrolase